MAAKGVIDVEAQFTEKSAVIARYHARRWRRRGYCQKVYFRVQTTKKRLKPPFLEL